MAAGAHAAAAKVAQSLPEYGFKAMAKSVPPLRLRSHGQTEEAVSEATEPVLASTSPMVGVPFGALAAVTVNSTNNGPAVSRTIGRNEVHVGQLSLYPYTS